ncbi:MAG: hypothetical protein LBG91_05215 [Treponema sp.]|jgi:hypothetical protein|nr:hypothetical protein [Treponema sp.]
MTKRKAVMVLALFFLVPFYSLHAQRLNSVPLGHPAYDIIQTGVLKGVVTPPPSAKPWSELIIQRKLREMLNDSAGRLSLKEQKIVAQMLESFERENAGLNLWEGKFNMERETAGQPFTLDGKVSWESDFRAKVPDTSVSTVNRGSLNLGGDMGGHLSWGYTISAGFLYVDRELLGMRPEPPYIDPKWGTYDGNPNSSGHGYYYDIYDIPQSPVYAIPSYFPYTFTKLWESSIFPPDNLGGREEWPNKLSFFYEMFGEISTAFFDDLLYLRFGRMTRDWGPGDIGSSLYFNGMARPFMAVEGTASPFKWVRLSSLTGALEYPNNGDVWKDAEKFQNFFSISLLEFDIGRHFHLGFGSSAVYPKRFEFGYIFPLYSNFFYQNVSGDFDNMAIFGDLEIRFTGAKIWGGFFIDEMRPVIGNFFNLNRNMYSYQGGVKVNINWLPLGVFTMRYTKIEPYCYTHEYRHTPWHRTPGNTAYHNNGESLGSNLPPNSDELMARLEAMPLQHLAAHLQYQMLRHGADWGYRRVPGSNINDKIIKDDNTEKFFLRDGVYQWDHVIKFGGCYTLRTRLPLSFTAEAGIVITRFTDSDNEIGKEGNYSPIDNPVYRAGTGFVFSVGFKLYP